MLLSFENFGFKRKVENFPFWKTFHYENIAKVFRFGELSGNFKTTNCTIFFIGHTEITEITESFLTKTTKTLFDVCSSFGTFVSSAMPLSLKASF